MRPLEQQTVLVTGATDGHGREVARRLAASGATVIVHGRNETKAEETRREIAGPAGADKAQVVLADLASLDAVRRLAAGVESSTGRLDAIVNNAGLISKQRAESEDGHELTFAVNYLSHFVLTSALLPLLRRSAPARVVNVASIGQSPIAFGDIMLEQGFVGMRAYNQSKLAQIMFSFELAYRLNAAGEEGVTSNALHPATMMDTKMVREIFGWAPGSIDDGAEATVRLVTDPELEGVSGRYFEGLEEAEALDQAYEPRERQALWELSETLTGSSPPI